MTQSKRALLSVSEKEGLLDLGRGLVEAGFDLIASGGTAKKLADAGLRVVSVSEVTGFPELLGGRVKTLHPAVHGGILAKRTPAHLDELAGQGLGPIDVVVCNLYPFEKTIDRTDASFEDAIENIDIGGVTLLRAAAKNCAHVVVLCDPRDYDEAVGRLRDGEASATWRLEMARKAFGHTAQYDAAIANYFSAECAEDKALPAPRFSTAGRRELSLRYGENPHQAAALYSYEDTPLPFEKLQGKALSYNNLIDLDGAWSAVEAFEDPAVAIIKHTNPCGLAIGIDLVEAFQKALACDPISAFGSIIAVNRNVDVDFLEAVGKLFVEVLVAPSYSAQALEWLQLRKKNCRAVLMGEYENTRPQIRSIRGGFLVQSLDDRDAKTDEWQNVTKTKATPAQVQDLALAWRAAKVVKSNAIVIARDGATVGVGAGQMNRLESVMLASKQAGEKAKGAVLASDAFFPFADGLEAAVASGVTAVAQPGGSVRDDEVIAAADRLGVAMLFTGVRHFKH